MDIINARILNYRECVRHLWNTNFFESSTDQQELFESIEGLLFEAIVLVPSGYSNITVGPYWQNRDILKFIKIVPRTNSAISYIIGDGAGTWEEHWLKPGTLVVAFEQFFDWDEFGRREWQYFRGVVEAAQLDYGNFVGRDVLIEVSHGSILIDSYTDPSPGLEEDSR